MYRITFSVDLISLDGCHNDKSKANIKQKVVQYLERAEKIKKYLESPSSEEVSVITFSILTYYIKFFFFENLFCFYSFCFFTVKFYLLDIQLSIIPFIRNML